MLQYLQDGAHRSKIDNIRVSDPDSSGCFRYWFARKFLFAYMYVPHSLFAALSYLETGHACGSVKPWDSTTISWKKLADFHTRKPSFAVGLGPASLSVSGSELKWCNCFRWSLLQGSTARVGLRPGNMVKAGWISSHTCHRPFWVGLQSQQENRFCGVGLPLGNRPELSIRSNNSNS